MHNYTTIIGVIRMRKDHISIDKVRHRYGIGSSGIALIMKRFEESGLTFKEFEALEPSKVEEIIYPKDNLRRKKIPLPDFKAIYERLMAKGSKANLFYQWMEYKKDNPDGYQYSQFVEYFNRYVEEHYAAKKVSMAVERIPGEYSDVSEPPIPDGGAIPIPEMRTTHSENITTLKTGRSIIS